MAEPRRPLRPAEQRERLPRDQHRRHGAGRFIRVPDDVADGDTGVAPQTALETWSNDHNVLHFVRVEDLGYDPDSPRTVYFAEPAPPASRRTPTPGACSGRPLRRVRYYDSDGRVFKIVLNEADLIVVDSFSIVAQGKLQLQEPPLAGTTTPVVT